jgi:hypothetical protein
MLQLIGLVLLAVAMEHGMAEASLLFGAAYAFVQAVQISAWLNPKVRTSLD